MKYLREWATPLTIGVFLLMGVTGALMFFRSATTLNKEVHEWAGLVMIAAVASHAVTNWPSIKRYFRTSSLARGLVGSCILILMSSFITLPGQQDGGSPKMRTFNAVVHAPIESVALLTGDTPEKIIADLTKVGITITNPQQSIDTATSGNRELQEKAVIALFTQRK